jgi:hypothetical protein
MTICHLYYPFDDDEVIVRALWAPDANMDPRSISSR